MKLRYRGRTDVGRTREHNEDDYGFGEGAPVEHLGELLVVCDGMGGHAAGEVASHLGVDTILAAYYSATFEDRTAALRDAFEQANTRIHAEGRGSMGTTGVAALLHQDALAVANVGDSRAYLIRNGTIRQISRDHSLVSEQIAAGVITAEQARSLYYRNVITRALGYQPEVVVDTFRFPLQVGDLIVLSSDGLHTLVTDEEILALAQADPIEEAVDRLVDLANERGGNDNITVVIARVDGLEWAAQSDETPSHERTTVELQPAPRATLAADARSIPVAAPPLAPAPRPAERRLGPLGVLLSSLLLAGLVAAILFMSPGTASAPGDPLTPDVPPPATFAPTTVAPTGAPTRAATIAPTTAATTAATALATASARPAATALAATRAPAAPPAAVSTAATSRTSQPNLQQPTRSPRNSPSPAPGARTPTP